MTDLNTVKEKIRKLQIRKLLDLASDDSAAQGEIENAMRFADQMMAKHNLTRSDVSKNEDGSLDVSKMKMADGFAWSVGKSLTSWEGWLASLISNIVGSVGVFRRGKTLVRRNGMVQNDERGNPKYACPIVFYGPEADVQMACELYEEIQQVTLAMARLRWGGYARGDGAAYCEGFVQGFAAANRKEKQQARQLEGGNRETALVLIDSDNRNKEIQVAAKQWLQTERKVTIRGGGRSSRGSRAGSQPGKSIATRRLPQMASRSCYRYARRHR